MIYELRTYTLQPGTQGQYLKNSAEIGRKIRGDKYGKFEGGWSTEFGTLNQYVHLWSFESLNERERLRAELAKNEEWTKTYLPQARGALLAQEKPEPERASESFETAVRLFRESGDAWGEALALITLGRFSLAVGEARTALDHFEKSLALTRARHDERLVQRRMHASAVNLEVLDLGSVGIDRQHVGDGEGDRRAHQCECEEQERASAPGTP